jgi:RecB family endonuclease NucS
MKIGEMVKNSLSKIKYYCENVDNNELNNLLNFDYSKRTFGINFPFFIETKDINEKDIKKQARRFYKNIYQICEKRVHATSQWYDYNTDKFKLYMLKIDKTDDSSIDENVQNEIFQSTLFGSELNIDTPEFNNFTYERDLQNSLITQAENLFPGFKIYGNYDGVEYNLDGKRIDLLLENKNENKLLAIELKAGSTDYKTFGQISMYLGLLSKEFPNIPKENINGIIIAGEIDKTLKDACLITDKIKLMEYTMKLSLEEVT